MGIAHGITVKAIYTYLVHNLEPHYTCKSVRYGLSRSRNCHQMLDMMSRHTGKNHIDSGRPSVKDVSTHH